VRNLLFIKRRERWNLFEVSDKRAASKNKNGENGTKPYSVPDSQQTTLGSNIPRTRNSKPGTNPYVFSNKQGTGMNSNNTLKSNNGKPGIQPSDVLNQRGTGLNSNNSPEKINGKNRTHHLDFI
jgi:hypothetical protein